MKKDIFLVSIYYFFFEIQAANPVKADASDYSGNVTTSSQNNNTEDNNKAENNNNNNSSVNDDKTGDNNNNQNKQDNETPKMTRISNLHM
ncbi:hypothetical protein SDC49_19975 [Lactobacillus sp. R2/2]|nr:hypothetical protein [Lactobacillus sp. R2/2]